MEESSTESDAETKGRSDHDEQEVCHLVVDAASTPARVAAVLFADTAPDDRLMQNRHEKRGQAIPSLENIAVLMGLTSFAAWLQDR